MQTIKQIKPHIDVIILDLDDYFRHVNWILLRVITFDSHIPSWRSNIGFGCFQQPQNSNQSVVDSISIHQ